MSTPPRRLRFAVGSSLLTASLSLAGCTSKPATEPETKKQTQKEHPPDTVNEGPEPEPKPEPKPEPEPGPDPDIHVNPGPEERNPRPEPPLEDKRVNTRPDPQ